MTTDLRALVFAVALAAASPVVAGAQEKASEPTQPPTVPLKVQIVISRYEGDKKLSSLPYMLSVNAGRSASLRMGTKVPVASTSFTPIATGGGDGSTT